MRAKLLDNYDGDFRDLQRKIQGLETEVEHLRYRNDVLTRKYETVVNSLSMAQATWTWEAHLARFVVNSDEAISLTRRFLQMQNYEKKFRGTSRWDKIQRKFGKWTNLHWEMVNVLRNERRGVAHPHLDLDAIENSTPKLEQAHRQPMRNMLDMLKLTASLMKFGRLAKFYQMNKNLFQPLELAGTGEDALRI